MRANFHLVSVPGVFDALHHIGLERISFLKQLVHTLRIRTFDIGQSLQISRLLARLRPQSLQSECHRIHALAFLPNLFLKWARRFPSGSLLAPSLRFHLRLFRSSLLPARSALRLRLLVLGFLFCTLTRSVPPLGHS